MRLGTYTISIVACLIGFIAGLVFEFFLFKKENDTRRISNLIDFFKNLIDFVKSREILKFFIEICIVALSCYIGLVVSNRNQENINKVNFKTDLEKTITIANREYRTNWNACYKYAGSERTESDLATLDRNIRVNTEYYSGIINDRSSLKYLDFTAYYFAYYYYSCMKQTAEIVEEDPSYANLTQLSIQEGVMLDCLEVCYDCLNGKITSEQATEYVDSISKSYSENNKFSNYYFPVSEEIAAVNTLGDTINEDAEEK